MACPVRARSDTCREAGTSRLELGHPAVEAPGAVVVVERVVVAADELDRPPVLALQEEDDVADGLGLVVVPLGDVGVEDEVALRPARRPAGVGGAQGVVALVGAHAGHVDGAVGAEGGDDVVGAAVVEGVGVGGEGGAHAFGDVGEGRLVIIDALRGRGRRRRARAGSR